jgi:hypothetical protein
MLKGRSKSSCTRCVFFCCLKALLPPTPPRHPTSWSRLTRTASAGFCSTPRPNSLAAASTPPLPPPHPSVFPKIHARRWVQPAQHSSWFDAHIPPACHTQHQKSCSAFTMTICQVWMCATRRWTSSDISTSSRTPCLRQPPPPAPLHNAAFCNTFVSFCSFFRMQIDTRVFAPFTLHYSTDAAAAAASPISKLCSAAYTPAAPADATDNFAEDVGSEAGRQERDSVGDSELPLVLVTAASSDFFNNSLNLIGRCFGARLPASTMLWRAFASQYQLSCNPHSASIILSILLRSRSACPLNVIPRTHPTLLSPSGVRFGVVG